MSEVWTLSDERGVDMGGPGCGEGCLGQSCSTPFVIMPLLVSLEDYGTGVHCTEQLLRYRVCTWPLITESLAPRLLSLWPRLWTAVQSG